MRGPTTPEQLQADVDRLGSLTNVAREYGISRNTLQGRATKWGTRSPHPRATGSAQRPAAASGEPQDAGVTIEGDTATITLDPGTPFQPEQLLTDHGLDPAEWIVMNARPNSWQALAPEGEIVTLHQLKVEAVRRIPADMILPARTDGWRPLPRKHATPRHAARTILVVSDTHAPYHEEGLHDCLLQWIELHKPAEAWDLGDLLDLPTPSRHRTTKGFDASPQECIDTRYRLDAERVAAHTPTRWRVLLGNHDDRIEHAIIDKVGAHVARIARAGDTMPVMDLGHLLRYDEIGIELVRPQGEYFDVVVEIAPGLNGRHGTKTGGKHGGSVKTIERRACSQMQGHAHKAVAHLHTRYDDAGVARDLWSLDVPTMARRDIASSYMEDGDVDGTWHPEMARYDDAACTLYFRDERYTPLG